MGKKGKGGSNLGRALIKDRFGHTNRRRVDNDSMLHTTEVQDGYDWGRLNLTSVTEESSFHDFLRTAEMAGTEFQAEKLNIQFINPKSGVGLLTKSEQQQMEKKHAENRDLLKIPRRPKWTKETTADELQRAENESFLDWRRGLKQLEEDQNLLLTPYEKNLDFWRQLWRVVERSDVIVQIVDARNPLLFRNLDLEKYVKEVNPNKMNMILVNKSDLLSEEQRKHWAEYFDKEGIFTAFFSATVAEEEFKKLSSVKETDDAANEKSDGSDEDSASDDEDGLEEKPVEKPEEIKSLETLKELANSINESLDFLESKLTLVEERINPKGEEKVEKVERKNDPNILSRLELITLFKSMYAESTYTTGVTTIGLVGYPNVGKSSTINALMTQKKVSVSATPGKTKHFQTLFLDEDLMLCDCPGLVMPSFMLTKADMILNGILPIDQMRDYVPPVNLLCTRIPRHVLEDKYGIIIAKPIEGDDPNRPPYAEEFLLAYAYNRGFMTAKGQPDQARAARYVCKDYVNGKLLYCLAPPSVAQDDFHTFPARMRKEVEENSLPAQQQRAMRISLKATTKDLDQQFFDSKKTTAHVKGRTNFPHVRVSTDGTLIQSTSEPAAKPWRQVKKDRREKLRKKFSHLDEH